MAMSRLSIARLFALPLVLLGIAAPAQSQEIRGLELSKSPLTPGEEVTIKILLKPANGSYSCGLRLQMGDGESRDIRGTDAQDGAITVGHRYPNPGTYSIRVEGKSLVRGLNSLQACPGTRAVQVVVTNPKPACAPPPDEYRAVECPTGTQGKILQKRTFACPGPVPGAWTTESTDCRAVPVAAPTPAPAPVPERRVTERRTQERAPAPTATPAPAPKKIVGE